MLRVGADLGLGAVVEHGSHNNEEPWEEGWESWLYEQHMWDPTKSFQALYIHYRKFSGITFDAIPRAEWWRFYWDLLPMEDAFTYGETIGHVDFPCA